MKAILGQKVKMSQVFSEDGERFPVTEIATNPCTVLFENTLEKNGYLSLGLGFGTKRGNKPLFLREIRIDEGEKVPVKTVLKVDEIFEPGDLVNVTGVSKGLGFTGVVKRHGFKGGPRTHGQSDRERAPGSIGSTTTPGRVLKGKKMAGKEGNKQVTLKNLLVVKVDPGSNCLLVRGALPGKKGSFVIIKKTGKKAKTIKKII